MADKALVSPICSFFLAEKEAHQRPSKLNLLFFAWALVFNFLYTSLNFYPFFFCKLLILQLDLESVYLRFFSLPFFFARAA